MILKKSYLCLSLLLCFTCISSAYATKGNIKGKIIDSHTKEALIGAIVSIENTTLGTVTDEEGNFLIPQVEAGVYNIKASYVSYQTQTLKGIKIASLDTLHLEIALESESQQIEEVSVVAKANRESENILLLDQRKSVSSIQNIGAAELSRKGIDDAAKALVAISGISKQDGVKNVIVRGLGDRYNASLLNGLPVPSEDPEYKNIALSFFETDIIKNIQVDKVFPVHQTSDAGGAVIDIQSKELTQDHELTLGISTKVNTLAMTQNFIKTDGYNYLGYSDKTKPASNEYNFKNSLDPNKVNLPINESYKLAGGKKWMLSKNSLSMFGVITHASEYKYAEEQVRNVTTDGTIYQDQVGKKYTGKKNQLVLANVLFNHHKAHELSYNFMMLHASQQYIGEYIGKHSEKFQDGKDDIGFLRRQQINDNTLYTHQLLSKWKLSNKWTLNSKASYNQIKGYEPDRRENYLSKIDDGSYRLTGSNRQKRFFSALDGKDVNAQLNLQYQLNDAINSGESKVTVGYFNHIGSTHFEAVEYNFSAVSGALSADNLHLDNYYNQDMYDRREFSMEQSYPSQYEVSKNYHTAFVSGVYHFSPLLSGTLGIKYDRVNMAITYDVPGQTGTNHINANYFLPSLNLRYNLNEQNSLRLGASKTYTLPQSKEISPYQYINIGFASEGNPKLKPSDNYNLDLKWDHYLSASELISAAAFYKKIVNPIGRVDKGNSAGLLTYDNISKSADVMGFEVEVRKNILSRTNIERMQESKLSIGMNGAYILTQTRLQLLNTPSRTSTLEGAAPLLLNADISYKFSRASKNVMTALVFNYYSDKVHTIGTLGYQDIIEKAIPTLDYLISTNLIKGTELKLKVGNILNPSYRLTRKVAGTQETITLNQFKKGIDFSIGVSIKM